MTRLIFCTLLYAFTAKILVADKNSMEDDDESYVFLPLRLDEKFEESNDDDYSYSSDGLYVEGSDSDSYSSDSYSDGYDDFVELPIAVKSTCRLPLHPGFCSGRFRAWGFDWKAKSCVPFLYHGCLGNENNFAKKTHCESKCLSGQNLKVELDESEPTLEDFDNPMEIDGGRKTNI